MYIIGYVGLVALGLCWIPQSFETIKNGFCPVNRVFLFLSAFGSASLMVYAILLGDPVFTVLNFLTSVGASINLFYSFFGKPVAGE